MAITPRRDLTGAQKNALYFLGENSPVSPAFALTGPANPHMRVFVAHFDGTENDREQVPKGSRQSLVAESYDRIEHGGAVASEYYPGVGCESARRGRTPLLMDSATGNGSAETAAKAYVDLMEAAKRWKARDPLAQIHVHAVGFSRGSATALHFLNLVNDLGCPATRDMAPTSTIPPGAVKASSVLIDTVATGQEGKLMLSVPDCVVSLLHVIAGDERRPSFPLINLRDPNRKSELAKTRNVYFVEPELAEERAARDASSRVTPEERKFRQQDPRLIATNPDGSFWYQRIQRALIEGAAHSDAGGTYLDGGIREHSEYMIAKFQRSLGLPVSAEYGLRPAFAAAQSSSAHESLSNSWIALDTLMHPFLTTATKLGTFGGETPGRLEIDMDELVASNPSDRQEWSGAVNDFIEVTIDRGPVMQPSATPGKKPSKRILRESLAPQIVTKPMSHAAMQASLPSHEFRDAVIAIKPSIDENGDIDVSVPASFDGYDGDERQDVITHDRVADLYVFKGTVLDFTPQDAREAFRSGARVIHISAHESGPCHRSMWARPTSG